MNTPATNLSQAFYHASRGWASFPLFGMVEHDGELSCSCSRGADCDRAGKHPATSHGHNDATTDPEKLREMFAVPYRNVGLATGMVSGLAVIDIDPRHNGMDAWLEYCTMFPAMRTNTYTIKTGSDGLHLYYAITQPLACSIGLLTGVDLKADGGYVVSPPSTHFSGGVYSTIDTAEILPFPQTILDMIASGTRPEGLRSSPAGRLTTQGITAARQDEIFRNPQSLGDGERDTFFTFASRDLVRAGRTGQEILDILGAVYDGMRDHRDFTIDTVVEKITRAFKHVPEDERTDPVLRAHFQMLARDMVQEQSPEPDSIPIEATIVPVEIIEEPSTSVVLTESDAALSIQVQRNLPEAIMRYWNGRLPDQWEPNAQGIADLARAQYGDLIRYVREIDEWIYWDLNATPPRWRSNASIEVRALIRGTIQSLKLVALTTEDEELRDNLIGPHGFVVRMGWPGNVKAVLNTLELDFAISMNDLNPRTDALPLENGVIVPDEAQTLEDDEFDYDTIPLHVLEPKWLFTKQTKLRHADSHTSLALAEFWQRSLVRWFPDPFVREFAQRLMGYAVFGGGREKVFTIAYGERDSGKSAFFGTFMRMLNDFAVTISPDALLKQKFENEAQTGLSHISGARLYVSSETQAGAQLNIPLLKRFASGGSDAIRTRAMRKDFIDIIPRGLLVIQTNNIPENEELDDALWSRTIILPFEGSFPTDDPDTIKGAALDAKMISQREGILQWLIEGYESYLYMGLRPPRSIERALTRVRDLQDWVTPFVAEFLDRDDSKSVGRKDLRLAYELWCRNTDTPIVPNHGQWTRLIDTGLGSPCERGTGNKMVWKGWAMKGIECATELPTSMRSDL